MTKGIRRPAAWSRATSSWPPVSASLRSSSIRSPWFWASQASASWPELAVAIECPSRCSVFSSRRNKPESSSTMRMRAAGGEGDISGSGGRAAVDLGNLDQADEHPELLDGLGELLVIDRFHQVIIAAQIVAARNLPRVVGGGEHAHVHLAQVRVGFDSAQHLDAVD